MVSPNKIPEGFYFIAKDSTLNEVLTPADSQVSVTAPPDIVGDLCTSNSGVWNLKLATKDGGKYDYFSISSEDATALSYDETTMEVVLEDVHVTDDRQLWRFQNLHYMITDTGTTVRRVKIRNKYDPSCFLDVGTSNEAVGQSVAPSAAHQWALVNLAPLDLDTGPDSEDEDMDDIKENRDWLRDMLFYFSARFGRAHESIGHYPYQDSHVRYPYPRNALVTSGWRHF